jgi:hypothetical protein
MLLAGEASVTAGVRRRSELLHATSTSADASKSVVRTEGKLDTEAERGKREPVSAER